MRRLSARLPLAALLLACPAALRAQAAAPGRIPVLRAEDGTEVWVDSASVVHLSPAEYVAKVVTQFLSPVAPENAPPFDRAVDSTILDCAGGKERLRVSAYYRGDALVHIARGDPADTLAVDAERRPTFDALCRALAGSSAAALPLPLEGVRRLRGAERQPRLLNPRVVTAAMRREYPADLRGRGVSGQVTLWFRVLADGSVHQPSAVAVEATDLAFVEPALRVVATMRFQPAAVGDTPVPVWVSIPMDFIVPSRSRDLPPPPGMTPPPARP